jgi:threonine/homoserine efflux transporter RhtA
MSRKLTTADKLQNVGAFFALVGVLTVAGGIVHGLKGNKTGLDQALMGAGIVAVSSLPLSIAREQQEQQRRAYVRRLRFERGAF